MPRAERDWERRIGGRLKLRDLHILSTAVQWGSMAKAATHLAMSQPAVSEAIANLEAALKVRLLDRNAGGVEPTLYATALLKRERAVFDELQQGIKEIAFLANPTAGEVRLATTEVLACGLVPHVIERLSRRYPQILIHAVVADPTTLEFRELRERRVDILLARVPEVVVDEDIELDIFTRMRTSSSPARKALGHAAATSLWPSWWTSLGCFRMPRWCVDLSRQRSAPMVCRCRGNGSPRARCICKNICWQQGAF